MKSTLIRLLFGIVTLAMVSCSGKSSSPSTLSIAVIPKGTSHIFWQSIRAGAERAGKELGVEIIWRGPLREDDRDSQVSEVEGFVSRGVSGIVLAPLDETALQGPVADAKQRNIPVVIFDSGLKGSDYVSFVATDNLKGGELGGERLAEAMNGKGKAILLRYAEGHDSTAKREQGFLDAMKKHAGIEVVSSNQYVGADVEGAYKRAESILSSYKKPDGSLGIDGIFTPNESSTFATLRVLQDNGWAGKVKFVGFDSSDNMVKGLRDGVLDGLVVQDPVKMGYLGVKTIVAHIKGQPIEKRIDTGVHVVTPGNMNEPEMNNLLHPDLSKS
jgi:ribose transport system substrate-binding protein